MREHERPIVLEYLIEHEPASWLVDKPCVRNAYFWEPVTESIRYAITARHMHKKSDRHAIAKAGAMRLRFVLIGLLLGTLFVDLWPADAADTVLTLACQGTTTDTTKEDAKPKPASMGIVVNYIERTVRGFGLSPAFPLKITDLDDVSAMFSGSEPKPSVTQWNIHGRINRLTGDVVALSSTTDMKTGQSVTSTSFELKCRPAQRMS